MKTSMAVLLTILIMLGLAGGGYYYLNKQQIKEKNALQTQIDELNAKLVAEKKANETATTTATADATASWKTYTNSTYKFSFRYPTTWSVKSDTASNNQNAKLVLVLSDNKGNEFKVLVNADGFGTEWATNWYKGLINANGTIQITNRETNDKVDKNSDIGGASFFGLTQGNNRFDIVYTFKFSDRDTSVDVFEQIIATFQFTK